jgi:hypothetical protein
MRAQVSQEWQQHRGSEFDKAVIANQAGKLGMPVFHDLLQIVGFEVAVMRLMEGNQNGHTCTCGASAGVISLKVKERARFRCLAPLLSRYWFKLGKNPWQKSSTSQNNSSKLSIGTPFLEIGLS